MTLTSFLFHTGYMARFIAHLFCLIILVLFGPYFVPIASAASLGSVSDTITTSRPSAATTLTANAASGVGQVSVLSNGSNFFASDSATIIRNTGTVIQNNINVASQSSALTTVYFGNTLSANAQQGTDTLMVPVTARHTIVFNTITSIPASGTIVIQFPGPTTNTASPSASSFGWNNLQNSNVSVSGATCGSLSTATPGTITCTTSGTVSGGTTITVVVGSNTPTLINPTKSAAAGFNDSWLVSIQTTDASSNPLDSGFTKVATIDSIQVMGTIEPTLTFIISGIGNGVNINTISSSCGSITTNTGLATTPTAVNMGILNNGYVSAAAHQLQVSTNAATGYVITATSSGKFMNPATGVAINDANGGNGLTNNDTPAPATITAGTPAFGIHACGARSGALSGGSGIAAGDIWTNAGTITTARFSNPWNTGTNAYYNSIASYTGGPITTDNTAILYGATISGSTPAGVYLTTLTYVATATF